MLGLLFIPARRYDEMLKHRAELFRWHNKFILICARAEESVPIYATL